MKYKPSWELDSIPDEKWASEHGRRQRAKGPRATYVNLKPCEQCGRELTATERRKPCPQCGHRHKRGK